MQSFSHFVTQSFCNRHVIRAAQSPIDLDDRQAHAVAARIELDLRLGAAFTRFTTLNLQMLGGQLAERVMSYGRSPSVDHDGSRGDFADNIQGLVNFQLLGLLWIDISGFKDLFRRRSGASKSHSNAII